MIRRAIILIIIVLLAACSTTPSTPATVSPATVPAATPQPTLAPTEDTNPEIDTFKATVFYKPTWVVPAKWATSLNKHTEITFQKRGGRWIPVNLGVPQFDKGPLFAFDVDLNGKVGACGFNMSSLDQKNESITAQPTDNCVIRKDDAKEVVINVTLRLPYCDRPQDGVSKTSTCKFAVSQFGYLGYSINDDANVFEYVVVGAYTPEMREPLQRTIDSLGFQEKLPDKIAPGESVTLRK